MMMSRKSLKDLAWDVSEEVYRADPALSYSTLSKFHKLGPRALISNEKIDTVALRMGSLVDCILTSPEEFEDKFYVADIDKFSDTIRKIVESFYSQMGEAFDSFKDIRDCGMHMLPILNEFQYQTNWKDVTRLNKIVELGSDYYTVLKYSTGKTVISPKEFEEAQKCVLTLKTHPFTYKVFECNEDEEIFYQLKFESKLNDVNVRIMTDICRVDHANKTIQIIDLKTSGKEECLFEESFLSWNYMIQASLYKQVLKNIISNDEYFKDFKVLPFNFLVINKISLSPIIWSCGNDDEHLELELRVFDKNKLDWRNILSEASWHIYNEKFNYPKRIYDNNGIIKISI